jgi:hypothetical protein
VAHSQLLGRQRSEGLQFEVSLGKKLLRANSTNQLAQL